MKPKDIKPAFTWEERCITLQQNILHLPDNLPSYSHHSTPSFDSPAIFNRKAPLYVEYCSGNGAWIIEKAIQNPDYNWIAVEKQFGRAAKIASKAINRDLKNLLVVCGQAEIFSEFFLSNESVSEIFINFPDPWPKKRHAKHRLMKAPFVKDIVRTLLPKGSFWFVSDDWPYFESTLNILLEERLMDSAFPAPFYITDLKEYGDSYFKELWKEKGRTIHYQNFIKNGDS